jgi:hypothetical protein
VFGSAGACDATEILTWNLGTILASSAVTVSLPPMVLASLTQGSLIEFTSWAEDTTARSRATLVLRVGIAPPCLAGDTDGDGACNDVDNCTLAANPTQLDTDGDGIGNMCDCDFNQDGFCGGPDFTAFIGCFNADTGGNPVCEAADMTGDGFVGGPDFTLFIGGFNGPPGPSAP